MLRGRFVPEGDIQVFLPLTYHPVPDPLDHKVHDAVATAVAATCQRDGVADSGLHH